MIDFRNYLEYAEKHQRQAAEKYQLASSDNLDWLLIPAVVLAWSAMESFVNNRLYDYSSLPEDMFELHERAFLLEKKLTFKNSGDSLGKFILESTQYHSLDDKIFFLISKFGSTPVNKGEHLWQRFQNFKEIRDGLVHPKQSREVVLNPNLVQQFIETAKEVIQFISKSIWNKKIDF